ncbi:hypothetical protein KVA01_14760 [Kocuria varians]|uniref:Uncharacterized protein n=1 Tax=Kocuria varians TaxID=1272 RepID=A0A4Y4D2C5_KOCVA|nr:hypothetical protein [Kocuria varians]GEC99321.1 hypothetical protein KVA01_14760 [Kocuria varians]
MSPLYLLSNVTVLAAEEGHSVNEQLHEIAPVLGGVAFVAFIAMLLIAMSFSSRGTAPAIGEYENPAELPADEQAMLAGVGEPVRH